MHRVKQCIKGKALRMDLYAKSLSQENPGTKIHGKFVQGADRLIDERELS